VAGRAVLLKFSPDGGLLATSHADHAVRLWNSEDGSAAAELKGHSGVITGGGFSRDGRFFATASEDGTSRLWELNRWGDDLAGVSLSREFGRKSEGMRFRAVNGVVVSADHNYVAAAGESGLQLWDARAGGQVAALEMGQAESMAMSPDERRFATIHLDRVMVWEIAGVNPVRWRVEEDREDIPKADMGQVRVITSKGSRFSWSDHRAWEPPVAIASDGRITAAATGTKVMLRNGESGRILAAIEAHSRVVTRAVFNVAGNRLLTTSNDGSAKIWDAWKGALVATLAGHEKPVVDGAFDPAGNVIATASEDSTARIWDAGGAFKSELRGHGDAVRQVAFSGDGTRIISISDDKTARVWVVGTGRRFRSFAFLYTISLMLAQMAEGQNRIRLICAGELPLCAGTAPHRSCCCTVSAATPPDTSSRYRSTRPRQFLRWNRWNST
jgi:WD40 repeat protein